MADPPTNLPEGRDPTKPDADESITGIAFAVAAHLFHNFNILPRVIIIILLAVIIALLIIVLLIVFLLIFIVFVGIIVLIILVLK
jgi:uncharacterized membrane protein